MTRRTTATDSFLNATDRLLVLWLLTGAKYLKSPGYEGSLFNDWKRQKIFLSKLLGLKPSVVRNSIKRKHSKILLFSIMQEQEKLTQKEINDFSRRLNDIKKLFSKGFYPECIELIDKRLIELELMSPIEQN